MSGGRLLWRRVCARCTYSLPTAFDALNSTGTKADSIISSIIIHFQKVSGIEFFIVAVVESCSHGFHDSSNADTVRSVSQSQYLPDLWKLSQTEPLSHVQLKTSYQLRLKDTESFWESQEAPGVLGRFGQKVLSWLESQGTKSGQGQCMAIKLSLWKRQQYVGHLQKSRERFGENVVLHANVPCSPWFRWSSWMKAWRLDISEFKHISI